MSVALSPVPTRATSPAAGALARARRLLARRLDLVAVGAIFAAAQLGFFLAGVRWRDSVDAAGGSWQLLDPYLLVHDFVRSIFYLNAQPPLYNIEFALFAAIGGRGAEVVMALVNLGLGLVLLLSVYLLAVELGVPRPLALALGALFEISPATILYQYWQFDTEPTATTMTVMALCGVRYLHRGDPRYGLAMFACAAAVVLGNSTFQFPWLLALLAVCLVAHRASWRTVLRCAAIPLLVVGAWYVKNAVLFGTYSTSSWFGLNLSKVTLRSTSTAELDHLVKEKVLSPLALVSAFQPLSAYEPTYVAPAGGGVAALVENFKHDPSEGPNLNNASVVPLSSEYLHQDLEFIEHDPSSYLSSIGASLRLWFVPSDRYVFIQPNWNEIAGYANTFNRFVALEPSDYGTLGSSPTWSEISFTSLLAYGIVLIGTPLALLLRRRSQQLPLAGATLLWVTVGYTLLVTTLVEYGENNRFRFDLGPLPAIGAAALVCAAGRLWLGWAARGEQPSAEEAALG